MPGKFFLPPLLTLAIKSDRVYSVDTKRGDGDK